MKRRMTGFGSWRSTETISCFERHQSSVDQLHRIGIDGSFNVPSRTHHVRLLLFVLILAFLTLPYSSQSARNPSDLSNSNHYSSPTLNSLNRLLSNLPTFLLFSMISHSVSHPPNQTITNPDSMRSFSLCSNVGAPSYS